MSLRTGDCHVCQVSYPSKLALVRSYISAPQPISVYRHGMTKGDVRYPLERETNHVVKRWLESSNPPIPRAVADTLLQSHQCAPPPHCNTSNKTTFPNA